MKNQILTRELYLQDINNLEVGESAIFSDVCNETIKRYCAQCHGVFKVSAAKLNKGFYKCRSWKVTKLDEAQGFYANRINGV